MKTKTLVLSHWEDVVFENRNRSYGAYALRRAYPKRIIIGWGITVALFAALLYLPDVLLPKPSDIVPSLPTIGGTVILTPPPLIPPKPKPITQAQPARSSSSGTVVVTRDPVETTTEPIQQTTGTEEGLVEGGSTDAIDGEGLVPIIEPVTPPAPPKFVDIAEVMPKYEGGHEAMMKFIQKKIRVPSSFKHLGVGGTVYVRFIVSPDGKVTDVEVIRGISKDCDREAARVISIMPGWIAGMQNGTPVPVRMVLPIRFAQPE